MSACQAARVPALQVVARAGYCIVFAGHSLGAGAAVLLAMLFKRRGIDNVYVYGFGSPPCMERKLALSCTGYVQSLAFRDDAVVRFSPQALVKLHGELLAYDWKSAYEVGLPFCLHVHMHCIWMPMSSAVLHRGVRLEWLLIALPLLGMQSVASAQMLLLAHQLCVLRPGYIDCCNHAHGCKAVCCAKLTSGSILALHECNC